jgi:hypothetical protein
VACPCTGFCVEHVLHVQPFYTWPFPKPWRTPSGVGVDLNRGLHKNNVLRKSRCFTQKPFFTQTPCFIHKPCSCWACTPAVCRLHYSSFHIGRRNTPKAVKLYELNGDHTPPTFLFNSGHEFFLGILLIPINFLCLIRSSGVDIWACLKT